ncbi:MAG: hypothetical protein IJ141_08590 [Lachnospiraceae bacterium]|nr:hypothetical protein [Lachnospiraceae bacterium]
MEGVYKICFYGGLTLAIILLITSIILFAVFKIPKVIGDLTGRNARREIAEKKKKRGGNDTTSSRLSREEKKKYYNQGTGKITVRDSATNEEVTDNIKADAKAVEAPERETDILRPGDEDDIPVTAKIPNYDSEEKTTVLGGSDTEGIDSDAETDVLKEKGKADFDPDAETDVLRAGDKEDFDPDAETDVLRAGDEEDFDPDAETDVLRAIDGENDFNPDAETDVLRKEDEESDFDADGETDILRNEDTEDEDVTTVLTDDKDEATTVLSTDDIKDSKDGIRYIYDIVVVNTDESL